jgi:hypothetical protein
MTRPPSRLRNGALSSAHAAMAQSHEISAVTMTACSTHYRGILDEALMDIGDICCNRYPRLVVQGGRNETAALGREPDKSSEKLRAIKAQMKTRNAVAMQERQNPTGKLKKKKDVLSCVTACCSKEGCACPDASSRRRLPTGSFLLHSTYCARRRVCGSVV